MITILVVDDSPIDRQLLEGLIRKDSRFNVIVAETAAQALNRLAEWGVDLVITDLQMPGMDGLELVQWIREQHPDIPTILATGQGSEQTAAQALRTGAAGYVPKTMLAEQLLPTIHDVINIMSAERNYRSLIDHAKRTSFLFELDNNPQHIPPLIDLCEKMLLGLSNLDPIEQLRIGVAIEQALHNAVFRGNLEIDGNYSIPFGDEEPSEEVQNLIQERLEQDEYANRKTRVELTVTDQDVTVSIEDQGPGFAVADHQPDLLDAGRGLVLMHSFMDEVEFNEAGNKVRMTREWSAVEPQEPLESETQTENSEGDSVEDAQSMMTDDDLAADFTTAEFEADSLASDEHANESGETITQDLESPESTTVDEAEEADPFDMDDVVIGEEEEEDFELETSNDYADPPVKEEQKTESAAVKTEEAPSTAAIPSPALTDSAALRMGLGVLISKETGKRTPFTGRKQLIGRRNTCHISVPYHEVSSHHCQLMLVDGWWVVKDLNSSNGTKINGKRVDQGRLMPGDILGLAHHEFEIQYAPSELGAVGFTPPPGVN